MASIKVSLVAYYCGAKKSRVSVKSSDLKAVHRHFYGD